MKIKEFLETHYLHDSLVEEVIYKEGIVKISIDFCFWMQEGYQDEQPETGVIILCFSGVTSYSGPLGAIDDYSILEAKYANGSLTLLLMDDYNNISYEMKIISATDEVEIL